MIFTIIQSKELTEEEIVKRIELLTEYGADPDGITSEDKAVIETLLETNINIVKALNKNGAHIIIPDEVNTLLSSYSLEAQESKKGKFPAFSSDGNQQKFGSLEHKAIGDKAFKNFLEFIEKVEKNPKIKEQVIESFSDMGGLALKENLKLSPGEIVCLAGDFFGPNSMDEVIAFAENDKKADKFDLAFKKLLRADPTKVEAILEHIKNMAQSIKEKSQEKNQRAYLTMHERGHQDDVVFTRLTSRSKLSNLVSSALESEYLELLKYNFDHFGEEAKEAYRVGHLTACAMAIGARIAAAQGDDRYLALLLIAVIKELFSCHYLSDLFSAGHIRTPRKPIYDFVQANGYLPGKIIIAGLLAEQMHNEDDVNGLWVKRSSDQGDQEPWQAFGDNCYFEPENEENRKRVIATVYKGLCDVYEAFQTGTVKIRALDEVPKEVVDMKSHPNPFPLFKEHKGTVTRRAKKFDPLSKKIIENWSPSSDLAKLVAVNSLPSLIKQTIFGQTSTLKNPLTKKQSEELRQKITKIYNTEEHEIGKEITIISTTTEDVTCKMM